MITPSTDDDVAGPFILLQRAHDGKKWSAESFNLLEDAIKAVNYNEWQIVKPAKLKIVEDDE